MICLKRKYSTTRLLTKDIIVLDKDSTNYTQHRCDGGLKLSGYCKKTLADKPLVSIITATFNRKEYLEETIQSVINQTYDNVEYIVIDGWSTDGTMDVIRKYNDKIDYWLSEPDGCMYEALNKGITLSSGDIVAVLNSDDKYVGPQIIEQVVRNFRRHPHIDGLYGDLIRLYPNHTRYKKLFQVNYKEYLLSQHGTFIPHTALFVRQSCIQKVGFYNTNYRHASDYDFILRCLQKYKLKYINIPITFFRVHNESLTASGKISREKLLILKDHKIDRFPKIYRWVVYVYLWSKYKLLNVLHLMHTGDVC